MQFHWRNDAGWRNFDEFLGALESKKRKNIRQERAQIQRAGIVIRVLDGHTASDADLVAMYSFYCATFSGKGNHPALTLDFFRHLARTMPEQLLVVLAEKQHRSIAGALLLRGSDTLYGRYWGTEENHAGLHFECCYYQGIEICLRHGLTTFEPGAQGEHKIARGFLPVLTHSRHFIVDEGFSEALQPWCAEERASVLRYRDLVLEHSPYRDPPADRPARS